MLLMPGDAIMGVTRVKRFCDCMSQNGDDGVASMCTAATTLVSMNTKSSETSPNLDVKTNPDRPEPYALPYQSQSYEPVMLSLFNKTYGSGCSMKFATGMHAVEGRLLQAQRNPRQIEAGNLHEHAGTIRQRSRASHCRTAHHSYLTVFAVRGIPAQHTWRSARSHRNKLDLIMQVTVKYSMKNRTRRI